MFGWILKQEHSLPMRQRHIELPEMLARGTRCIRLALICYRGKLRFCPRRQCPLREAVHIRFPESRLNNRAPVSLRDGVKTRAAGDLIHDGTVR